MNKLYFTKYLPVEGEIKEGNKFIIDVYNSHQYGIKTAEVVGYNTIRQKENFVQILPFDKEKCKKVKLFLCSRDIQVGDKVKSLNDSIQFYPIPATQRIAKNELGNYYKVIGEVSEYALSYVTEGMEFEENEIKISQNAKFKYNWKDFPFEGKNRTDLRKQTIYPHSPSFSNSTWEILNPLPEHILIKIKGQCGHFH